MGNSHDTITTAARKAVLSWFAKRQTEAPAVEAQLLEDMCLGDLADLQEYVRERYGADAEAHLRAGITCGSQVPIEMVGVISDKQFARQQSTEILLSVPDPVFVEAVGAARRAMCATYEAVGGSALTQEADDYIQRVFARHGIPTELLDVSAAVAAGSSEDSPPTLVDDATDLALDLFGTRWRHITVKAVETFLNRTTDHEPLTWESKGTALPKQRDDVAKWVAGFANRDGGYLILGFDHNDALGLWEQAPIEFPDAEPATWLSRIIRDNCSPTPEFDVRVLSPASAGGLVLVQVQANIGFLTLVNGRIAERQPGETVWLKDGPSVQRAQRRVDARSRSRPTPRVNATAGPDTPRAPASARPHISDDLPPEEFVANLRQLLQNAGDSDLAVFLAGADERVTDARDAGDLNHLAVQLDRLADCAAVTLAYEPTPGTFAQCIAVLRAAFDIGIGRIGRQNGALSGEQLWVEILGRVRALGGLAVRLKRWDAMKLLILQEVHEDAHRLWPFWFRYGDTWANRSRLYQVDNNVLETSRQPLRLAAGHASRLSSLHPDGVVKENSLITAICRFDFLNNALSIWTPEGQRPAEAAYPYYAAWDGDRVRPIAGVLAFDTATRQTLLPGASDASVANLLQLLAERADRGSQGLGSWQTWGGFLDTRLLHFIAQNGTVPPEH